EPGLGAVRVAAHFPETLSILRQELDLTDPFRALPRVELRRDHPAWAAMFARQRFSLPGVHQEDIVFERARKRNVRGVRDERARGEVVAGAQDEARGISRHSKLRNRPEPHAAPVIVVTAPG